MRRHRMSGWWFLALPALVCVPCLLLPLFVAGGAAVASVAGGLLGGVLIAGMILLVGGAASVGVYLVLRGRRIAACCSPNLASPATLHEESVKEVIR